jgi:hypothetical protein
MTSCAALRTCHEIRRPITAAIREVAHQFLFLGVDRNRWFPGVPCGPNPGIGMLDLLIATGAVRVFDCLPVRCEDGAQLARQRVDHPIAGQGVPAASLPRPPARQCGPCVLTSCAPIRLARRDTPVACDSSDTPPPTALASAPATVRRVRTSRRFSMGSKPAGSWPISTSHS